MGHTVAITYDKLCLFHPPLLTRNIGFHTEAPGPRVQSFWALHSEFQIELVWRGVRAKCFSRSSQVVARGQCCTLNWGASTESNTDTL